jgi:hypothetical protein
MGMRSLWFALALVLSAAVIVPSAAAKKKPPPPPPPPPPSTSTNFVHNYANVLNGVKCSSLTPEVVQATSDGGSIALAHSDCRSVSWVVKLDAFGNPQWQKEVGCFGLPPGGYALGLALEQTADGGYVIGGGTRDCEFAPICPWLSSVGCGHIVKLDATGNVVWSRIYSASPTMTTIEDVKQTSDGGFVAVGTFLDGNSDIGGLVLKVDGAGIAQWQRLIGPLGRTHALLYAVQQTRDGGYVAAGESYTATGSLGEKSVLVVRLDASGNVAWQRGFNSFDSSGAATAWEFVSSIIQTSEGGYLVGGAWGDTLPGTCCQGPLLVKLDANGRSEWQKAYSGGIHCYFDGYSTRCTAIGGLAYSVHQTADGGYSVGGAGHLKLNDSVPMVPWLAKTDTSGNLAWQHFYYQVNAATGRTLSQYFASSALTSDGGYLALGFTTNYADLTGELFVVRTDSGGLVGGCSQVQPATPLQPLDPGLVGFTTAFPVQTTAPAQGALPAKTQPTSITGTSGTC